MRWPGRSRHKHNNIKTLSSTYGYCVQRRHVDISINLRLSANQRALYTHVNDVLTEHKQNYDKNTLCLRCGCSHQHIIFLCLCLCLCLVTSEDRRGLLTLERRQTSFCCFHLRRSLSVTEKFKGIVNYLRIPHSKWSKIRLL